MEPSPDGAAGGSSLKRSEMSVDEKRRLVHELSKNPDSASEALLSWTCQELTQVLSAESGKERKYTGLKKAKIVKILLETVTEKNSGHQQQDNRDSSPVEGNSEKTVSEENQENKKRDSSRTKVSSKRRRKNANPSRYVSPTSFTTSGSTSSVKTAGKRTTYCRNVACRATLRREDVFCQRCTCSICRKFDDNKDPSLWLTCNSDPPFAAESCGLTCHLACAFKSERSGVKEDKPSNDADGCFFCVTCGKINSLLECWKKQLVTAKETASVDILCIRLQLAQKLLKGTEKYRNQAETVEKAVKCLETELCGALTSLPSSMCRGNVSRLRSAPEVKDHCSSALKSLEDTLLDEFALPSKMQGSTKIRFEDVHATSLTLILGSEEESSSPGNIIHYSVWHREVSEKEYPNDLTCALVSPNTRFIVSGLTPATEYCFKVVSFIGTKESSVDETKVSTKTPQEEEEEATKEEETQLVAKEAVPENSGSWGFGLEHCVKIIRQLERSGYVEKSFRQKFLTWYSLRATAQEINVVKTFIDGFKDDLVALAEQLVHTFSDYISRKPSAIGGGDGDGVSDASAAVSAGFIRH